MRDDDRRTRAVHLTDAGKDLLKRAFQVAAGHETWLCEPLSPNERDQLIGPGARNTPRSSLSRS